LATQVAITALLETGLRDPLQVEEADDVGEEPGLGIHPLRVGLKIDTADAEFAHPLGGFGIQLAGQFDAGFAALHRLEQVPHGLGEHRGELAGHVQGTAQASDVVAGEGEVAGVGPDGEALFIQGHQAALAIDDGSAPTQGCDRLGLDGPGPIQQFVALNDLDPSQAEGQPTQPGRQEAVDEPEPPWRDRLEVHNLVASRPATFPWSRGTAALQPLGSHQ